MRIVLLGGIAAAILALPAQAATVTIDHATTDWTPFAMISETDPQVVELYGSEIFEEYHNHVVVPPLDPGPTPDWVDITYDLMLTASTAAAGGVGASFTVALPGSIGTLVAGSFDYGDTSVHVTGSRRLEQGELAAFLATHAGPQIISISGGAASYQALRVPQGNPLDHARSLWGASHVDATLVGTIDFTARRAPAPARLQTVPAPVPLPASGLLLGAALLVGFARRKRD